MAVDPHYTQCLLFIVCEASKKGGQKSSVSSRRSKSSSAIIPPAPKGYVLLPEASVNQQPGMLEVFKQNNLCILNDRNVSSLQLGEDDKLEIIELLLDERSPASSNPLSVRTNAINSEVLRLMFRNVSICNENEYRTSLVDIRPAVDEQNLNIFRQLVTQKADIHCRHDPGESLLHVASKRGPEILVQLLLELGADVNVRRSDGATALHLATKNSLGSVVQLLLERGADVQAQWDFRGTPLHHANSVPILKMLLRNGARVDSKDSLGHTALFNAIGNGDLNLVKVLLSHGADVNIQSEDGRTPIYSAVGKEDPKLTEVLLKFGAKVNIKHKTNESVLQGAFPWSPAVFQYLLDSCFLDLEALKESLIFKVTAKGLIFDRFHSYFCLTMQFKHASQILASHIVKIIVLNLHDVEDIDVSLWDQWFPTPFSDFKIQCEKEVVRMKEQAVGDANVSFYDILTLDASKVAGFLRNNVVAENAAPEKLRRKFPIYGNILTYHFQKGKDKKLILDDGIKICNFLFHHFKKLPYEIKERILSYLSFQDFSVLKEACGHFKVAS